MSLEKENIWHLKNFNIFKVLSKDQMMNLQEMISTDWIKRKSPVYLQGDPTKWVYFLKKGLVKLALNSESGKTVTVALLKPGEIFGELAFEDEEGSNMEAIALKDSYLCRMSSQRFLEFTRQNSDMILSINKILGLRMRKIENSIQDMIFLDVPSRLAKLLHDLVETDSEETPQGRRITLPLTHQELANLIGATREMVSIVLGSMADEGLIVTEKRRLIIPDPTILPEIYKQ